MAERVVTLGSPTEKSGARAAPPEALFTYRRLGVPPAQRRPSPKGAPETEASPWRKIVVTVGSSPDDVNTTVSGLVVPFATRRAPFVFCEFAQPRPVVPRFPHGQNAPLPSP